MEGKTRHGWEFLLFLVVIAVAIFLMGSSYLNKQKVEKQTALRYQLQMLRNASLLYKSVNKTSAPSLQTIVDGSYRMTEDSPVQPFIKNPPKLTQGKLNDPFGKAYSYTGTTGWIASTTPGYEKW